MATRPHLSHAFGGEEIPPDEQQLMTVPNLITLIRLLCIPVFLWLLFGQQDRFAAAVLLSVLGATDWIDGYIARTFNQTSGFGKMFDPTVDRLLLVVGITGIMIDLSDSAIIDYFLIYAWIMIIREVILSTVVVLSIIMGARRMDVLWAGKCGTFATMVAFPAFLAAGDTNLSDAVATGFLTLAWVAAIPSLGFSMIAFVGYLKEAPKALKEGRAAKISERESLTHTMES